MALTYTDKGAGDIVANGVLATFPAGSVLEIYSGSAPGPGAAPTGTLLVSIALPSTPWAASGRGVAKQGTWSGNGVATGNAGYFRIVQSGDSGTATQAEPRVEGTVTATGGGGDMEIDNVSIAVGQAVTVTTGSIAA